MEECVSLGRLVVETQSRENVCEKFQWYERWRLDNLSKDYQRRCFIYWNLIKLEKLLLQ